MDDCGAGHVLVIRLSCILDTGYLWVDNTHNTWQRGGHAGTDVSRCGVG